MEGLAIRSEDSAGASGDSRMSFYVVEVITTCASSDYDLAPNELFRIMTGAEVPKSADAVVMFEQAKETADGFTVRKAFSPEENIALQGEECKTGDVIVSEGTFINPGTAATLATFGYS